jgi:hypothetical protein
VSSEATKSSKPVRRLPMWRKVFSADEHGPADVLEVELAGLEEFTWVVPESIGRVGCAFVRSAVLERLDHPSPRDGEWFSHDMVTLAVGLTSHAGA